jgi:hypothetical protein
VAVVLCTGCGEAEAQRRFGRDQPAGYLQKPYSVKTLAMRVYDAQQARISESP